MGAKPTVMIVENAEDLAARGAELFVRCSKEAIEARGASFVAISGGSTPRAMHGFLAEKPYRDQVIWDKLYLYWVDDRCVPYSDPDSNYGAATADFISKVPLLKDQVHPMPTWEIPEEGAGKYEMELDGVHRSPSGFPRFDVIFLGLGTDGHTASLFPQQEALEEKSRWIVAVKGGNPDVYRLTMTLPVLNNARRVVFLATGAGKAPIVKAVLEDGRGGFPAERISPVDGPLTWLLDRKAASLLTGDLRVQDGKI